MMGCCAPFAAVAVARALVCFLFGVQKYSIAIWSNSSKYRGVRKDTLPPPLQQLVLVC
jgi:hypothetical protein